MYTYIPQIIRKLVSCRHKKLAVSTEGVQAYGDQSPKNFDWYARCKTQIKSVCENDSNFEQLVTSGKNATFFFFFRGVPQTVTKHW